MRHQPPSAAVFDLELCWRHRLTPPTLPPPSLPAFTLSATLTGGNPDSNTLISDMTTVICLDDYHSLDRKGRSEKGVTALAPEAQNFDLMAQQVCGPSD